MFVSVIVPSYNHAQYLEDRIESILKQSYSQFEVILLDDLSSDHSAEILEKYKTIRKFHIALSINKIQAQHFANGTKAFIWQRAI